MSNYRDNTNRQQQITQQDASGSYIRENNLQDEIWIPKATDSRGHGVNITVRVPPQVARLMAQYTSDPRFPYTHVTDFCRHSFLRQLNFLASLPNQGTRSAVGQLLAAETICAIEETHQQFERMLDRLNNIIQGLVNKGTKEAKDKASQLVMKELRYMQETGDPYYQTTFTDRLRAQYADLINNASRSDFMNMSEGPVDLDELKHLMDEVDEDEAGMIDRDEEVK